MDCKSFICTPGTDGANTGSPGAADFEALAARLWALEQDDGADAGAEAARMDAALVAPRLHALEQRMDTLERSLTALAERWRRPPERAAAPRPVGADEVAAPSAASIAPARPATDAGRTEAAGAAPAPVDPLEALARRAADEAEAQQRRERRAERNERMRAGMDQMIERRLSEFRDQANLTEEQYQSMTALAERYGEDRFALIDRVMVQREEQEQREQRGETISDEERQAERDALRQEFESLQQAERADLATVLDPAQMEQYNQTLGAAGRGFGPPGGGRGGGGGRGPGGR